MKSSSIFALLLASVATRAADVYVATDGVDAADRGGFGNPYRTIDYAADRANPGDTILIRGGTYREMVTPSQSGTPQNPIVYRPYQNETVVITGLNLINPGTAGAGQWVEDGGGAWRIQLNGNYGSDSGWNKDRMAGCQVFIDGVPMSEARWPNTDTPLGIRRSEAATATSGYRSRIGETGVFASGYRAPGLENFSEDVWTGGIIVFAAGSGWYRRVSVITGNTPTGANPDVRFNYDPYNEAANRENPNIGDPFFLMGRRIALDTEGEYFFDTTGPTASQGLDGPRHTLYLIAPGGGSPATRVVEMRRRQTAISLSGVSHLRFENLHILAGRIKTASNSSNCEFKGVTVEYAAYTWQEELGDEYDNIIIRGNNHRITDSVVRHSTGNGILFPNGGGHIVRNTVIADAFLTGIEMKKESSNIRVENVTVYQFGGGGISGSARPNFVIRCHGYQNGLFATDVGLLNAGSVGDSLGSEWAYNWMHTARGALNGARYWYGTPAIRLDAGFAGDGPSNYLIHHNVVWNTTQPEKAIAIWALRNDQTNYQDAKIRVYNNTVDQQIGLIETFSAPASVKGVEIINNLTGVGINMNSSGTIAQGQLFFTDLVVKNNVFPNRSFPDNPTPPHLANRQGSPGWLDPNSRPFGYQLSAGSQAIDNGAVIPGITDGFLGAAPDIGAFESGRRPFIPGAGIRPQDLAGLVVTPQLSGSAVQFIVSGLPAGRTLPEQAHLKIGNSPASNNFALNYDFNSHLVTAAFNIPSTPGDGQAVEFSLDGVIYQPLPYTLTFPDPGDFSVPPGVVRETFIDGAGILMAQQFPGTAGDGWSGPWERTDPVIPVVSNSTPLLPESGNFLRVTRDGGSGSGSQLGVFRPWSVETRPAIEPSRLTFDIRLDSSLDVFNNAGDSFAIAVNSSAGASAGGNSSVLIRVFGAATGDLAAREWGVFNGDPGSATGYDILRFRPTGLIAEPGATYSFTVDIHAGPGSGETNGKVHGTYDVTITDGTNTGSFSGAGFRSSAYSSGNYVAFSSQQNNADDNLAFSIDSIEITAQPAPPIDPLELWRSQNFQVTDLANPDLESTLWGNFADPDGDGLPNLAEYALGTDPSIPNVGVPPVFRDEEGHLTLTYLRARADITYIVQVSDDLLDWEDLTTNQGELNDEVIVTDTPLESADLRFIRLKVIHQPNQELSTP